MDWLLGAVHIFHDNSRAFTAALIDFDRESDLKPNTDKLSLYKVDKMLPIPTFSRHRAIKVFVKQ